MQFAANLINIYMKNKKQNEIFHIVLPQKKKKKQKSPELNFKTLTITKLSVF